MRPFSGLHAVQLSMPVPCQVEMSGFEPPTPGLQNRCSPAELHPPNLVGIGGLEPPTSRLSGVRSNH